jgi:hypothetical protein
MNSRARNLICILLITPLPFLNAQKTSPSKKPSVPTKPLATKEKTWIFHEAKDPMTDAVRHTLFLYGTSVAGSGDTDEVPSLFLTCDSNTPRKIFINMGVTLDDPHPEFRFDAETETTERWFATGDPAKAYYKDDSIGTTATPALQKLLAEGTSGTTKRLGQGLLDAATGADLFIKRMTEHTKLLVRASTPSGTPKLVSFELSGLAEQLSEHGCPVTPLPKPSE